MITQKLDRTQRRKLDKRLDGIAQLLEESSGRIYKRLRQEENVRHGSREMGYVDISSHMKDTGFQPRSTYILTNNIRGIANSGEARKGDISLDLGCGNGGFALMAAAAGFSSYGIDINPDLIAEARKNKEEAVRRGLIDKDVTCEFATGSMYTPRFDDIYKSFVQSRTGLPETDTMPTVSNGDAYCELGINISDAKIIYSFPWRDQMTVLCSFLNESARRDAVFVLPHYHSRDGIHGMELDLTIFSDVRDAYRFRMKKGKEKKDETPRVKLVRENSLVGLVKSLIGSKQNSEVDTSVFHKYSG